MKLSVLIFLFSIFGMTCFSQNFQLQIIGNSPSENKIIDSLQYNPTHKNSKAILDEINSTSDKLLKLGYLENQIIENTKKNDSSYNAKFSVGKRINLIHIYIGEKILTSAQPHPSPRQRRGRKKGGGADDEKDSNLIKNLIGLDKKKDTLILPYSETETFLNKSLQKLEQNGFAFAKLKLTNIKKKTNTLYAELHFESGKQRQLNAIVVQFGESNKKNSFPQGHLKQVNKKYHNGVFNQDVVRKIQSDFDKFSFVNQIKTPEILFTNDTTKVYVYLEKRKSNIFDGFIGFANTNKNKLTFNGYLDLVLENTIKAGEQFALYWKSDGNNQKTFKASVDLPYIFKSPLGLKAQINIFKQDSIFQNTKTAIDLGYFIDYNSRIYLGYQATESSDIQNTNNSKISDYTNSFLTTNLEYTSLDIIHASFPKKTTISISLGFGSRITNNVSFSTNSNRQAYVVINALHNFYLNSKNCFNINYQNYFLKSDAYIINELYRFGGSKSIRGFAENSLQANFMTAVATEYRYIISSDLYFHTILDFGHYEDKSSNNKGNLTGIGFGMGLRTKNGVLKATLSNGLAGSQNLKLQNTIVSMNYNIAF